MRAVTRYRPLLPFLDQVMTARFRGKVDVAGVADCWLWTGQKNNQGYGRFDVWNNGKRTRLLSHRVAVTLANNAEIGQRILLHSCDNPPCCNPAHLRAGTQTDNMRDAAIKNRVNLAGLAYGRQPGMPRAKRKLVSHCKRGHEFTPENTRLTKVGRVCRACKRLTSREVYRIRHQAAIRAHAVEAACRGEAVDLSLWERRAAIDHMLREGIRVRDISRTLNVPRRTINGRSLRLRTDSTTAADTRSAA